MVIALELVSTDVCAISVSPVPFAVVTAGEADEIYTSVDGGIGDVCSLTPTAGVSSTSCAEVLFSACGSDAVFGVGLLVLLVVHASVVASTTLL